MRIKRDRFKLKKIVSIALLSLISQQSVAIPMTFNLFQDGFAGGGSITGTFTGDDFDMNGTLSFFNGEILSFMASWSGNGTFAATTWGPADFIGLVYELGTGDIGDDALLTGIEGVAAGNSAGFLWVSGLGPSGFGFGPGGGILGPTGAIISTNNLVQVTSVPEPSFLAIFALGLAGLGIYRRKKI